MFVGAGTHDISRGYRRTARHQYTVKTFRDPRQRGICFLPTLYTLVRCCHAWIFASSPFCFHLRASRRGNYNRITSVVGGHSASQRGTTCLRTECWRNSAVLSASRQQQATIMEEELKCSPACVQVSAAICCLCENLFEIVRSTTLRRNARGHSRRTNNAAGNVNITKQCGPFQQRLLQ